MAPPTSASHTIRIVSKEKYNEQFFFELPYSSLQPLPASSVRVRARLMGVGSNNLAYCSAGAMLHWWDAFPVPSILPAPYNDGAVYGVAPGWGIAEVLEVGSQLAGNGLEVGTTIYGFLPLSGHAVDLELKKSEGMEGHWIEISKQREKLMPLYQRYEINHDALKGNNEIVSAFRSTLTWGAGYVLNRFPFASWTGDPKLSPMPDRGVPWPEGSEDLKSALVVCLGAGGKTSRSFVQQLVTNREVYSGPKAVLEVSSNRESIVPALRPGFEHSIVTYGRAVDEATLSWVRSLGVKRIVICDFGSRDNVVEKLTLFLRERLEDTKLDLITIGGESKVYTSEEKAARIEKGRRLRGIPMNTSGIREAAIEHLGEATFFEQYSREFRRVLDTELVRNKGAEVLGVKLAWREGLQGANGLEQAWIEIAGGKIPGSEGVVVRL